MDYSDIDCADRRLMELIQDCVQRRISVFATLNLRVLLTQCYLRVIC